MADITRIEFDGVEVRLIDSNGVVVDRTYAVSGIPYLQNPNLSGITDTGPLPEGSYNISHSNIESRFSLDDPNNIAWGPGWGYNRVTLIPEDGTDTQGRGGFFLHGSALGNGYGSAGCIDLNTNEGRIFDLLREQGADSITVSVSYSDFIKENFHPVYTIDTPISEIRADAAERMKNLLEEYPELRNDPGFINYSMTLGEGEFETIFGHEQCFGSEVPIDMWPLDLSLEPGPDGIYDQDEVRAKVWKKPIELIEVGDIVVSFDENDNLVPGPVTRTFKNEAKILLDFHGTRVTPGHVYYRPDSRKPDKFETLIDVLRDDGVIQHQDGTLIRAATNVPVGDPRDGFVKAITGIRKADGTLEQKDEGRIRLGTRFLVGEGKTRKAWAVADLIKAGDGVVGDDELIRVGDGPAMPFFWEFGDTLPKPEDFVLACSGTTLEDIYKAAEWESRGPRLPAPMLLDRGQVQPLKGAALSAMPRNEPLDVTHAPVATQKPQRTLNRKQRKAMEAKQRKATKARKRVVG